MITLDANVLIVTNVANMPQLLSAEGDQIYRRKTIKMERETHTHTAREKGKIRENKGKIGKVGSIEN